MKKLTPFIALLLLTFMSQTAVFAQKPVMEGKITYTITYPDMELDNQTAAMMPTESVVYFKGNMSRTELSMGMGISSASIMNGKTGEMISLTDMMGNKTAMKMTSEELKKSKEKNGGKDAKVILSEDTKNIAGYPCKKAVVKNGDETIMELYYTDKINSQSQVTLEWKDIKGFPMEYVIDQGGLKMKMSANAVSAEKVSDDKFTVPKEYKLVSREEMMKMMMGGGE